MQGIDDILGFTWNTADGLPPKDMPECGFFHELCLDPKTSEFMNTLGHLCASRLASRTIVLLFYVDDLSFYLINSSAGVFANDG